MAEHEERRIGGVRIRIDRTLCVAFGDCIEAEAEAFRLDAEGIVTFAQPERVDRARLVAACDTCPVDALTAWDETGAPIVPSRQ